MVFFSALGRVFFSLTHMSSCLALEGMTPSVGDQSTMERVTVATAFVGAAVRASAQYVARNASVSQVRWPQSECEHSALAAHRMKTNDTRLPRHLSRQLYETFGRHLFVCFRLRVPALSIPLGGPCASGHCMADILTLPGVAFIIS